MQRTGQNRHTTVTVAVQHPAGSYFVEWTIPMAGAVSVTLPTVFVCLALGRRFMPGLLSGAIKERSLRGAMRRGSPFVTRPLPVALVVLGVTGWAEVPASSIPEDTHT